jgi:serine protease AprX
MKNLLKILTLSLTLCGVGDFTFAQNKYFVLFKDKANSPYSVSKPTEFISARSIQRRTKQNLKVTETDLPPNPAYINEIKKYKSRWLNGVLVETSVENLAEIKKLSFFKGIEGKGDLSKERLANENKLSESKDKFEITSTQGNGLSAGQLAMLGVDKMQEKNLRGEGMWIGVLDSGFQNADKLPFFKHLFDEKRILGTYDFVFNERSVYEDHNHGTNVLSCMAAFTDNQIVGTAPKASYLLLKTEDIRSETRLEEANWLFAAEYADSVGVDVINTSLGYTEFDNKVQDYTWKNLDGETALITRAADFAASVGILVVVSAGNEGGGAWQKIGTPADADYVISVGAVTQNSTQTNLIRTGFSSYGGNFTKKIKPELVAQGGNTVIGLPSGGVGTSNGTSFSSPLLAGMAASLWAAYPQYTNFDIRDILIRSGSQYAKPDTILGHGLPNYERAVRIIANYTPTPLKIEEEASNTIQVSPNPFNDEININILRPSLTNQYNVELIDQRGAMVYHLKTSENQFKIQLKIPDGLYFLRVKSADFQAVKRIVKAQ